MHLIRLYMHRQIPGASEAVLATLENDAGQKGFRSVKILSDFPSRIVETGFPLCCKNVFRVILFSIEFHCQLVRDYVLDVILVKLIGYLKQQCLYGFHQSGARVWPLVPFVKIRLELDFFGGDGKSRSLRLKGNLRKAPGSHQAPIKVVFHLNSGLASFL